MKREGNHNDARAQRERKERGESLKFPDAQLGPLTSASGAKVFLVAGAGLAESFALGSGIEPLPPARALVVLAQDRVRGEQQHTVGDRVAHDQAIEWIAGPS